MPNFISHSTVVKWLSSNLFDSLLEDVFQKLNWEGRDVKINGLWLNNLRFADVVMLMSWEERTSKGWQKNWKAKPVRWV